MVDERDCGLEMVDIEGSCLLLLLSDLAWTRIFPKRQTDPGRAEAANRA